MPPSYVNHSRHVGISHAHRHRTHTVNEQDIGQSLECVCLHVPFKVVTESEGQKRQKTENRNAKDFIQLRVQTVICYYYVFVGLNVFELIHFEGLLAWSGVGQRVSASQCRTRPM